MIYAINLDLGIAKEMFMLNLGGGAGQITILILAAVSTLAITRQTKGAALTFFPVLLGYSRIGLPINPVWIIAAGVIWGVTLVGTTTIGSTLSSAVRIPIEEIQEANTRKRIKTYGLEGTKKFKEYREAGYNRKEAEENTGIDAKWSRIRNLGDKKIREKAEKKMSNIQIIAKTNKPSKEIIKIMPWGKKTQLPVFTIPRTKKKWINLEKENFEEYKR